MKRLRGIWITCSRRRVLALTLLAGVAVLGPASVARAHVPYVAYAWGDGARGTLGNGEDLRRNVPVFVKNLKGVAAIASERGGRFYGQALALLENGAVWGWGLNERGEVADGTTADKNVPVAVCAPGETAPCASQLSGVKAIAAGTFHSLALMENGAVAEWGIPGDGVESTVPVAKGGLSGVKAIEAGEHYSLALLENGTVVSWGNNGSGQLGNGTTTSSPEPAAVCAVGETAPWAKVLEGVKAIAAGQNWR